MKKLGCLLAVLLAFGLSPASRASENPPRILVIGDSLLAAHRISNRAVGNRLEQILRQPVQDRSVLGARMVYNLPITGAMGMSIPKQWRGGRWDWVVMNGGGNDLWLGCGCQKNDCDYKMNRLIARDGYYGAIPSLVSKIRKSGARVIIVGYMRSPGFSSPIESCKDEGDELEARLGRLAKSDPGIFFHPLTDMVPNGDKSFHASDRIHPSLKGSHMIAARIAQIIKKTR